MSDESLQIVEPENAFLEPTEAPGMEMVQKVVERMAAIDAIIDQVMIRGIHYAEAYPGAGKDSLLQPGAEAICMAFNVVSEYSVVEHDLGGGHKRFVVSGCLKSGPAQGQAGMGYATVEASTYEPKWRWRNASQTCPQCKAETIFKSKHQEGWYCWAKKGGCGATFQLNDPEIIEQPRGKVEISDPAELWHTVRRMAEKRWLVAVSKTAFGLSSRFVDAGSYGNAKWDYSSNRVEHLAKKLHPDNSQRNQMINDYALEEFGKPFRELTRREGYLVEVWMSKAPGQAKLTPESLTLPKPQKPSQGMEGKEAGAAEDPLAWILEELESIAEIAGITEEVAALYGPPGQEWNNNSRAIKEMARAL